MAVVAETGNKGEKAADEVSEVDEVDGPLARSHVACNGDVVRPDVDRVGKKGVAMCRQEPG